MVNRMTNKEAIEILKEYEAVDDSLKWYMSGYSEAFDMAIKALEQSEPCNDDKGCSNCMYSGRPTYKSPCSECRDNSQWEMKPISRSHENSTECEDTISRQEAIDALAKHEKSNGHNYTLFVDIVSECAEIIRDLPSVQPEQHWIPVSERMPEDGENCLVSVRCSNDFLVDRGTYSTDLFKVDEEHFFGKRGESGWYHLSSEYGYCKILNVIAWMPEPRPYKEIKDEGFN